MHSTKYPRTYHLPWSPGASADDKIQHDLSYYKDGDKRGIVILEKMDGENTTMTTDEVYARSVDSRGHPTRDWVKNLWGKVRWNIPVGWRVCGENMYALHSIPYSGLESYFLVFAIYGETGTCLDWEFTEQLCREWGLSTVPVLSTTVFDEEELRAFSVNSGMEGYVIRPFYSFAAQDFSRCVLKWVRPNHVETDEHWMHRYPMLTNGICS